MTILQFFAVDKDYRDIKKGDHLKTEQVVKYNGEGYYVIVAPNKTCLIYLTDENHKYNGKYYRVVELTRRI